MSSRNYRSLITVLGASLSMGCVAETDIGASGRLDTEGKQAVVGGLLHEARSAVADLDGDGVDDLVIWTNEGQALSEGGGFAGSPPTIRVFYGASGGMDDEVSPSDADVVLSARDGEFIAHVVGQDLNDDGAAELIVHAATESSEDLVRQPPVDGWNFPPASNGSVYVIPGGTRPASPAALAASGRRTPSYAIGAELPLRVGLPHLDLDGETGAEYLTQAPLELPGANTAVYVRRLETGAVRATLTLGERGTVSPRAVFDQDGDGHTDVAVLYIKAPTGSLLSTESWTEYGVGIFYGPLVGDVVLGDAATVAIPLPRPLRGAEAQFLGLLVDGDLRATVGSFLGGTARDLVLVPWRGFMVVLPGEVGRAPAPLFYDLPGPYPGPSPMPAGQPQASLMVPGHANDGSDALFVLRESAVTITGLDGDPVSATTLYTPTEEVSGPFFTEGGSATGDLDGDGTLDLVLPTRPGEGETESRVHVLYGFEG